MKLEVHAYPFLEEIVKTGIARLRSMYRVLKGRWDRTVGLEVVGQERVIEDAAPEIAISLVMKHLQ